ncbi:predicted protein [Botrytis cinerea T4]|uniref:Uncharacterized protein n=1 Tax=Botryotinia fuckeliana (strain T4) TaxID=999810 RepID=G2YXM2_BOTF4|nr:predicted protein [Botrytis cinerea T4]
MDMFGRAADPCLAQAAYISGRETGLVDPTSPATKALSIGS